MIGALLQGMGDRILAIAATAAVVVVTVMLLDIAAAHGADYRKITSKLYPRTAGSETP